MLFPLRCRQLLLAMIILLVHYYVRTHKYFSLFHEGLAQY